MRTLLLAASLIFRLIDVNSGLPDNNVRNAFMLPDGMMCIQTSSMLSLYDGYSIRSFRYDPGRVPYSEYSGLTEGWYDPCGRRIWCKDKDKLWSFDPAEGSFDYDSDEELKRMGFGTGRKAGFYIDGEGVMWTVSDDGLLWRRDPDEDGGAHSQAIPCSGERVLMERSGDRLWILSDDGMLVDYSVSGNGVTGVTDTGTGDDIGGASHFGLAASGKGLFIMTDKSIVLVESGSRNIVPVMDMPEGSTDLFTSVATDSTGNLWVGSARSGVSIVDSGTLSVTNLPSLALTTGDEIYHHTDISKIYSDGRGGIWVATLTEGLLYCSESTVRFSNVNHSTVRNGVFADEGVKCLLEGEGGTILVGTIKGLLQYDPVTGALTVPWKELGSELIISLYRDKAGDIWAGTFYNGAFRIGKDGIRHYRYEGYSSVDVSYQDNTPNNNCVRCFFEDSSGAFRVSTYGGVGTMDPDTGEISLLRETHPELEPFMIIRSICEPEPGVLLATGDNGSFLYDVASDRVLSTDRGVCGNIAFVDSRRLLWTCGQDGVRAESTGKDGVCVTGGLETLEESTVMAMAEDSRGDVWISTYGHIFSVRLNRNGSSYTASTVRYGKSDGMDAGALFQNSILSHSDGKLYFGGARGMTVIDPGAISGPDEDYPPRILSYSAGGSRHGIGDDGWGIRIKHSEVPVELSFSSFDFSNPGHTLYSYMMEGFDKGWQNIPSDGMPTARYNLIRPGDYSFRVRSRSLGGEWLETSVAVSVAPPFYASRPAMLLYALALMLAACGAVAFYRKRERARMLRQMEKEKMSFFTNISHELRTPLSLIMLPLQSLMKESSDIRLETIRKNADDLLDLVNHLLDFRKLEMGGEKLNLSSGDISEFVRSVADGFRDACERRKLLFEFEDGCDSTVMQFDASKVKKIVRNLLSNAVKFTPEGGYVCVRTSYGDGCFILEVNDSGIGIDPSEKERLFERFYRSSSSADSTGTGIGLNLVKQYVDMMSGRIEVDSEPGKGSSFRIFLPEVVASVQNSHDTALTPDAGSEEALNQDSQDTALTPGISSKALSAESPGRGSAQEETEKSVSSPAGRRSRILIVDDNEPFRTYLAGELASRFDVSCAENGMQALGMMKESAPDLVICDVMMPQMDGIEFTSRVKGDIETSHIPVILLTARSSDDARLEGYETGAEAFLSKPFSMDVLTARINNLLDERRRRRREFATSAAYSPMEVTVTSMDQQLMKKIMESVERNISNTGYSVEMLASDVSMHRMNLYRKLQAITGMAPLEFIRTMRLKRAAQILSSDAGLTVSEVAEMAGFSTTKYFSKYFKEMFGTSPSRYASERKL